MDSRLLLGHLYGVRASENSIKKVEVVLERLGSKVNGWQLRALFFGAQASTNLRLGPQHLFGHIFGEEPVLGDGLADANANLQVLMGLWNELVDEHGRGHVRLSAMRLSSPPTAADLTALAERREQEIVWFTRGIDAGGDDPMEFGPEAEPIFTGLAEGGAFCAAYRELLEKKSDHHAKELVEAAKALSRLTRTLEEMISDLMTISDGVRRRALAEFEARLGRRTDDGVIASRPVKVGRNAPCPCGSGRKWKRCCGAPERVQ